MKNNNKHKTPGNDASKPLVVVADEVVSKPGQDGITLLLEQGVSAKKAEDLARRFPVETVREQVAALDFRGEVKNRAAMLVTSLEENWALPDELVRRRSVKKAAEESRRREEETRKVRDEKSRQLEERDRAIDAYLRTADADVMRELEDEAHERTQRELPGLKVKRESPVVRAYLREAVAELLDLPGVDDAAGGSVLYVQTESGGLLEDSVGRPDISRLDDRFAVAPYLEAS